MKQRLIDVLEWFCPGNVFLQGTLAEDETFPDEFITFWTDFTESNTFYDDAEYGVNWNFSVIYYSNDPAQVNARPLEIRAALKAAGFIPQGKGMDIPSGKPSHTGWAMDFVAKENL